LVGVLVGVSVGVSVGVLVGVSVGVSVGVLVGVLVGVSVGVSVGVTVGVLVGVEVGVTVGVLVGVCVGVFVGVFVGHGSKPCTLLPQPSQSESSPKYGSVTWANALTVRSKIETTAIQMKNLFADDLARRNITVERDCEVDKESLDEDERVVSLAIWERSLDTLAASHLTCEMTAQILWSGRTGPPVSSISWLRSARTDKTFNSFAVRRTWGYSKAHWTELTMRFSNVF
jgi:hypothetical protein